MDTKKEELDFEDFLEEGEYVSPEFYEENCNGKGED